MYLPLEPFDELKWFSFSRTRLSCINHPCAFTVEPVNAHTRLLFHHRAVSIS